MKKYIKSNEEVRDYWKSPLKQAILDNMLVLMDARMFLLSHDKSLEAQKAIDSGRVKFNGVWVEIESPLVGGTDANWIRLNYDDVYIFLHDDGSEWYQLDPIGGYGAELIETSTYREFVNELMNYDDALLESQYDEF